MLIEVFEIFSVLHPSLLIASAWRKALQCKHMPFVPMAVFKRVARDQQIGASRPNCEAFSAFVDVIGTFLWRLLNAFN